jgi:gluconate kinase
MERSRTVVESTVKRYQRPRRESGSEGEVEFCWLSQAEKVTVKRTAARAAERRVRVFMGVPIVD